MKLPNLLASLTLALAIAACQSSGTKMASEPIPSRIDDTLSPGDVLRINFAGNPELNQTQKIRADGKISLPTVGETQAAGRGVLTLQKVLTAAYKPTLQNSAVTVTVDASTFPVIVLGAVNKPGDVDLDRPSLLQAIGKAGGITRGLGDGSKIRIIHEGESKNTARVVNLDVILKGKSSDVIHLQRGDTVIVPEKWL